MTVVNHHTVHPLISDYHFKPLYSSERETLTMDTEEEVLSDLLSADRYEKDILNDILNLSLLKDGWDYGIGAKISNEVIQRAIDIHNQIVPYGLDCEVHPTTEGGINLIYALSDIFMDVNINSNLSISLTKEQGIGFDFTTVFVKEDVNEKELIQEISSMSIEKFVKCSLSELSISKNTVQSRNDSQAIPLETTKVEFPFLICNVPQKRQTKGSASTFQYIIIQP